VKFWDSSAVVTLLMDQPLTPHARELIEQDPEIVVWWGTVIECASAIARVERSGALPAEAAASALDRLRMLRQSWYEVMPSEEVRMQAARLLRMHPLRAGDATQLAAALVWSGTSDQHELVSFDDRLNLAARREGFLA
jgi:predicted nucleic acid-binding protein